MNIYLVLIGLVCLIHFINLCSYSSVFCTGSFQIIFVMGWIFLLNTSTKVNRLWCRGVVGFVVDCRFDIILVVVCRLNGQNKCNCRQHFKPFLAVDCRPVNCFTCRFVKWLLVHCWLDVDLCWQSNKDCRLEGLKQEKQEPPNDVTAVHHIIMAQLTFH